MILEALEKGEIEGAGPYYPQLRTPIRPRPLRGFRDRFYCVGLSPESVEQAARLGATLMTFTQMPWEMYATARSRTTARPSASTSTATRPGRSPATMFCDASAERAEAMAREYMANYFLSIAGHYELMSEHFRETKGYDLYANASDAFRAVGMELALNTYVGIQTWGTPLQILEKLEARKRLLGGFETLVIARYGGMSFEDAERACGCSRARCCRRFTRGERGRGSPPPPAAGIGRGPTSRLGSTTSTASCATGSRSRRAPPASGPSRASPTFRDRDRHDDLLLRAHADQPARPRAHDPEPRPAAARPPARARLPGIHPQSGARDGAARARHRARAAGAAPRGGPRRPARAVRAPHPEPVIGEMIGIPDERIPDFLHWTEAMVELPQGRSQSEAIKDPAASIYQEFARLLDERRRARRDDLMSALIDARLDGARSRRRSCSASASCSWSRATTPPRT